GARLLWGLDGSDFSAAHRNMVVAPGALPFDHHCLDHRTEFLRAARDSFAVFLGSTCACGARRMPSRQKFRICQRRPRARALGLWLAARIAFTRRTFVAGKVEFGSTLARPHRLSRDRDHAVATGLHWRGRARRVRSEEDACLEHDPKKVQTFWIRSCDKTNRWESSPQYIFAITICRKIIFICRFPNGK